MFLILSLSHETIINQMIKRLEKAKQCKGKQKEMYKHLYHVHGLCELLIEESQINTSKTINKSDKQLTKLIEEKTDGAYYSNTNEDGSLFDF